MGENKYGKPEIVYEGEMEVRAGTPQPKGLGLPDLDGEEATEE